jgi:hypothetical protein
LGGAILHERACVVQSGGHGRYAREIRYGDGRRRRGGRSVAEFTVAVVAPARDGPSVAHGTRVNGPRRDGDAVGERRGIAIDGVDSGLLDLCCVDTAGVGA